MAEEGSDIEEDVDFEEYRLPDLEEMKGKKGKPAKAKPGKKAAKSEQKKAAGKKASEFAPAGGQPGKPEPAAKAPEEKPETVPAPVEQPDETVVPAAQEQEGELSGSELAEIFEEKGARKDRLAQENRPVPGPQGLAGKPQGGNAGSDGIERVSTGIQGFDELVEGGIPKNSLVLLKGSTGTGKSIFGMNFLVEGIRNSEPGVYITLEEPLEESKRQMRIFGWDIEKMAKEGKLALIQPELYEFDELLRITEEAVQKIKAQRLVFDSISILGLYFQDQFKMRRALIGFEKSIKRLGCTAIALSESNLPEGVFNTQGVEEFVADGLIELQMVEKENVLHRAVSIVKMRSTNHSLRLHPFQIESGKGLVVYPNEKVFTKF